MLLSNNIMRLSNPGKSTDEWAAGLFSSSVMADDNPDSDYEEEEDSPRSEHGDTTDGENEVIYYWERLRGGVMSHPASLQLQCLLFATSGLVLPLQMSASPYSLFDASSLIPGLAPVIHGVSTGYTNVWSYCHFLSYS